MKEVPSLFFYDHYTHAGTSGEVYDVILVEQQAIQSLRAVKALADPGASARRNIVVTGCSLQELVRRTFRIGEVTLRGLARHDLCFSNGADQADACALLRGADLGAQILTEGIIRVGDKIGSVPPSALQQVGLGFEG